MNESNIKLSIILPVYNVAPYLKMCLDSILEEIKDDTEVIIIDDGSTDDSPSICDAYALKDNRIRVRHQVNAGQSAARNAGLSTARGHYISFIDSDDFIDSRVLNYMVNALEKSKADFAISSFVSIPYNCDQRNYELFDKTKFSLISSEDFLQGIQKYAMQVWNKVYRRTFIAGLNFKEGILYEDVTYIHDIAMRMSKAVYIDTPMYYYRIARPGSTVSTFKMTRLPAYDDVQTFVSDVHERFSKKAYLSISRMAANFFQQQYTECKLLLNDKLILADILERYKNVVRVLPIKVTPLYAFLFRISPNVFCWLKKIKRK